MRPPAIGFDAYAAAGSLPDGVARLLLMFDQDGQPLEGVGLLAMELDWSVVVSISDPSGLVYTDWTLIAGTVADGNRLTPEGLAVRAILAANSERREP